MISPPRIPGDMLKTVEELSVGGVVGGVVRNTEGSSTCCSEGSHGSFVGRLL